MYRTPVIFTFLPRSLFSKLFPGTLTICMVVPGNPNFRKKMKLIFDFISNLVVLISTVFILALFFFSFPIFNNFACLYILACTALMFLPPRLFSTPIFERLHMGQSNIRFDAGSTKNVRSDMTQIFFWYTIPYLINYYVPLCLVFLNFYLNIISCSNSTPIWLSCPLARDKHKKLISLII